MIERPASPERSSPSERAYIPLAFAFIAFLVGWGIWQFFNQPEAPTPNPTFALANCNTPTQGQVPVWDYPDCLGFEWTDVETLSSSTNTADEDGIQVTSSWVNLSVGQGLDTATSPGDLEFWLDILEASLPTDSIWAGVGGIATEVALSSVNVGTASALAANPSDCAANQFATTIAADGDLTCAQPDHGNLAGLTDDDHTIYGLLAGRSGGQTYIGGTGAGDDITFETTSNGSKGSYIFSELDCSGNANGGALTANGSGVLSCTDDDSGGGGGSQNLFESIVAGAGTATADSTTDVLTISSANAFLTIEATDSPDSLTFTIETGQDWPNATTADALGADGANCSAGQAAGGVSAAGAAQDCVDYISETELDSESELEAQLTDVTDVFTNNDGALADDDLSDNDLDDLSDVVITSPGDASIIIYSTGSGTFSDFVLSGDCTMTNAGVLTCSNAATADALTSDPTDCSSGSTLAYAIASNGNLSCEAVVTGHITDGTIIEPDLNADNSANDGDILTYDSTGTNFAWVTPNAGTDVTADLEEEAHCSEHNGAYLTCNGEALDADAELYTWGFSAGIASVSVDDDGVIQWGLPSNATIAAFTCSTSTGTATVSLDRRLATTPNSAGDTVFSNLACDTDRQRTTSFTWSTITADYIWNLTIEAVSTSGINLRISSATGTYDD